MEGSLGQRLGPRELPNNQKASEQPAGPIYRLVVGDTSDHIFLDKLFAHHQIDCVMHFAAHIEVGESVQLPFK